MLDPQTRAQARRNLPVLAFVNRVGEAAEQAGRHPDIDLRYNRVRLALSTHDAGGVTAKDFDVARQINALTSA